MAGLASLAAVVAACQASPPGGAGGGAGGATPGPSRAALIAEPQLCGGCDPACWFFRDAPTGRDLDRNNSDRVRFDLDAEGLVLGGWSPLPWSALITSGSLPVAAMVDTYSQREVGRYLVGLRAAGAANQPVRTAVVPPDHAYVASRAAGYRASVTKIAALRAGCLDRNRSGTIETSSGPGDLRPWNEDECVIWTVAVGEVGSVPGALAVDEHGRIWVGLEDQRRFDVLHPHDGRILTSVAVAGRPFDAAVSRDGRLWTVDGCCGPRPLQAIDTATYAAEAPIPNDSGCGGSYALAVDPQGRVVVGGWPEPCVGVYDPNLDHWERLETTGGSVRGVAADWYGVWATHGASGPGPHGLTVWSPERRTYPLVTDDGGACLAPLGVEAGPDGELWTVCQGSDNLAVLDTYADRVALLPTVPAPSSHSGFTGFGTATAMHARGSYRRVYDARAVCGRDRTPVWSQLYWDVTTPPGTEIVFSARNAPAVAELPDHPEIVLATVPGDLEPADVLGALERDGAGGSARYIELLATLRSLDDESSPVFRSLALVLFCECACDGGDGCDPDCDCDRDCGG